MMPHFTSRLAFILVTAGAAVGLGNIWGFTYVAGKNGGGGFVLIYLLALLLVAAPIFIAELALGRMGAGSPPTALGNLANQVKARLPWRLVGLGGLIATIMILSFYGVIAGHGMAYIWVALKNGFQGWDTNQIIALDKAYKANLTASFAWGSLFTGLTALLISLDIRKGMERVGKILMPGLFLLLIGLVVYGALFGEFGRAMSFLFIVRPETLTSYIVFEAVGQAFFSVSVGVGGIMMLGAYMGEEVHLVRASFWIVLMDLIAALLAGLAIFPLVFMLDLTPNAGPGLVFITLPAVFAGLPYGGLVALVFFVMLTFAALTSSVSLIAPPVAWLEERGWTRPRAALVVSLVIYILSMLTILSLGPWQDYYPLEDLGLKGMTFFALIREGVNNVFLPLAGFSFALMVGWGLPAERVRSALNLEEGRLFRMWYLTLRYFVPFAISGLSLSYVIGH